MSIIIRTGPATTPAGPSPHGVRHGQVRQSCRKEYSSKVARTACSNTKPSRHVLRVSIFSSELPAYPKKLPHRPQVLSQEEVTRLIKAAEMPFHRILPMTLYATRGLLFSALQRSICSAGGGESKPPPLPVGLVGVRAGH
jgi:hypothetical protein